MSRLLASTLTQHPDWAAEMRQLLDQPASQEIIARNNAVVTDITMRISGAGQQRSGAGQQRIDADNSQVERVHMSID